MTSIYISDKDSPDQHRVEDIKAVLPAQGTGADPSAEVLYPEGELPLEEDERPANLELIEKHCQFMGHCKVDVATLSEPEWFAYASIVAQCHGKDLLHKRSAPYPGYNQNDAQAKLVQIRKLGPQTCVSIRRDIGFIGCESCPYRDHVEFPLGLGDENSLAQARIVIANALVDTKSDPGAMFTPDVLAALGVIASQDLPLIMRVRDTLKKQGIPPKTLEQAMKNTFHEAKASGQAYRIEANRFVMII